MNIELLNTSGNLSGGEFFLAILSIVAIDLVLAGDNAIVIGMSVRYLAPKKRMAGILLGTAAAVLLRVGLTIFAAQLLEIKFVKLIGGLLILWIAVKLIKEENAVDAKGGGKVQSLWKAVWFIVIADISMSTDNVLAVAGASKGHMGLLAFGLVLSIPIIVCASSFLSKFMDKYPVAVLFGAAILGKVAGDMIITEPVIIETIAPQNWLQYAVPLFTAGGVVFIAKLLPKWRTIGLSANQN